MSQSFNRIRQVCWQIRILPFMFPLVLYAASLVAFCMTFIGLWFGVALCWVAVILVLERTSPHGRPRWLARKLTPNFYSVRLLSSRWGIFQRCAVKKNEQTDCIQLLKELVADQVRLPNALPPGRYKALTHDTVLRRLQRMSNARDIMAKPAYMANMAAICSAMTAKRCKTCKGNCPFLAQRETQRQFYYVTFEITKR